MDFKSDTKPMNISGQQQMMRIMITNDDDFHHDHVHDFVVGNVIDVDDDYYYY